jgi:hypothetical protein
MNRSHIPVLHHKKTKKPVSRLTRGSRIKPVSATRAKINKIYSALRKTFLELHPYCQWTFLERNVAEDTVIAIAKKAGVYAPYPRSVDIHHMKGRGKYLLDTSTWMAVSRQAHDYIHANPEESYRKGYMLPRN